MNSFNLISDDAAPSMTISTSSFASRSTLTDNVGSLQNAQSSRARTFSNVSTLPLPESLEYSNSWDWSVEERNIIQSSTQDLIKSGMPNTEKIFSENTQEAVLNVLKRIGAKASDFTFGTNSALQRNNLAIDPLKEIFFNAVENRQFSFTWKFAPTNRGEYDNIRSMIRSYKAAASPEKASGGLLRMPDTFTIRFNNVQLPEIKECACTGIIDNYTDAGKPRFHVDGEPAYISMTMNLIEIDINERSDF